MRRYLKNVGLYTFLFIELPHKKNPVVIDLAILGAKVSHNEANAKKKRLWSYFLLFYRRILNPSTVYIRYMQELPCVAKCHTLGQKQQNYKCQMRYQS